MMKKIFLMFFVFLLGACSFGPEFMRPFSAAKDAPGFANTLALDSDQSKSTKHWWRRINDPLFNQYVEQLLNENLELQEAGERVIQAQERRNIARGGFFPTLGGTGNASRSFASGQSGGSSFSNFLSADRFYTNSVAAELNASWELDLFGRLRKSLESADAGFEANLYDREALAHSLIAALLNRRVAIAVNKNLLKLAQDNAENRKTIYSLVKRRYDLGTQGTSLTDVLLAEENYTTVQADTHQYERLVAEEIYQLDVLLGQVPGTTDIRSNTFSLLTPPLDVAVCLPADLLDRRPDLRAAELRVKAANADIGVAVADLYPTLSLGGTLGFSGDSTRNLFTADQLAGSILGSITARLFEGGSLRANIRLQESEARELAAGYAGDVLEAMREVETALNAETTLASQLRQQTRSLEALRLAEQASQERYLRGVLTLRDYLDTQQRRYTSEQNLLITQQAKWNTRVTLYLALGGDWLGGRPGQGQCRQNRITPKPTLINPAQINNEENSHARPY